MHKGNNVIDLKSRKKKDTTSGHAAATTQAGAVVDMTERRNEIIINERRQVRRTILTEFIGACLVVPERGLQRVAIYDISEGGISFDMDFEHGLFQLGEELAMRVYMNQQTYFPFIVRISNAREIAEEGVSRHGANFIKGTVNDEALHHFVRFIETVSASLMTDHGDVMVSNLRK